jgi:uncharacterized protein DUF6066
VHRLVAVALAVAAATAVAEDDPAFEKAKNGASPTDGLSTFLSKFVGSCTKESGPQCAKAAEEYRQKTRGKKLYLSIDDATPVLAIGGKGDGGEVVLNVTPFFAGGEYALTQGAPSRMDASGNPVVSLLRVKGTAPDGDVDRLGRMLAAHQVKMEVVFAPESTWSLTRKGGGAVQGVKAKLLALRISMARTGDTVATWTGR